MNWGQAGLATYTYLRRVPSLSRFLAEKGLETRRSFYFPFSPSFRGKVIKVCLARVRGQTVQKSIRGEGEKRRAKHLIKLGSRAPHPEHGSHLLMLETNNINIPVGSSLGIQPPRTVLVSRFFKAMLFFLPSSFSFFYFESNNCASLDSTLRNSLRRPRVRCGACRHTCPEGPRGALRWDIHVQEQRKAGTSTKKAKLFSLLSIISIIIILMLPKLSSITSVQCARPLTAT